MWLCSTRENTTIFVQSNIFLLRPDRIYWLLLLRMLNMKWKSKQRKSARIIELTKTSFFPRISDRKSHWFTLTALECVHLYLLLYQKWIPAGMKTNSQKLTHSQCMQCERMEHTIHLLFTITLLFNFRIGMNSPFLFSTWSIVICSFFLLLIAYLLWLNQVILFATSPVQMKQWNERRRKKHNGKYKNLWRDMYPVHYTNVWLRLWTLLYVNMAVSLLILFLLLLSVALLLLLFLRCSSFMASCLTSPQPKNNSNEIKIDFTMAINSNTRGKVHTSTRIYLSTCDEHTWSSNILCTHSF